MKPNEISILELKSGNLPLYYETFFQSKIDKTENCSIISSNSQSTEIKTLREDNLKMEKTIQDLKAII
jgi:hypothetical protein